MLTGHATVESAVEGLKSGATDYLMKPADIDELIEKAEEAFEKWQIPEDLWRPYPKGEIGPQLFTLKPTSKLVDAGVDEFTIDMKAWDPEVHEWYTGRTNEVVKRTVRHAATRVHVTVNTLVIPGIVDEGQVAEIARFLKGMDGDVELRVNRFNSALARETVARDPTDEEMASAIAVAEGIMGHSVAGQPCSRERQGDGNKGWITVYPNGDVNHRGIGSYREENKSLVAQ